MAYCMQVPVGGSSYVLVEETCHEVRMHKLGIR